MLDHFEQQLESTPLVSADEAGKMAKHRIANGGDEAELTEYYNSKIGKKLLFYIHQTSDTNFQVCKVFDDEVEDELKDATFIGMSSGNSTIPKFENVV